MNGVSRLGQAPHKKPMNSDMSQQIIDSAAEDGGATTGHEDDEDEEDDIPAYGFPSQPNRGRGQGRNRCEATDIDQLISDGGECRRTMMS